MKFKYKCSVCGKQLRNKKAVAGHMWLAHDIRVGNKAEVKRLREENKEINNVKEEVVNDGKAIDEIKEELVALKSLLTDLFNTLAKKEITTNPDEKPEKKKTFLEKIDGWLPKIWDDEEEEEETEETSDEKKSIFL